MLELRWQSLGSRPRRISDRSIPAITNSMTWPRPTRPRATQAFATQAFAIQALAIQALAIQALATSRASGRRSATGLHAMRPVDRLRSTAGGRRNGSSDAGGGGGGLRPVDSLARASREQPMAKTPRRWLAAGADRSPCELPRAMLLLRAPSAGPGWFSRPYRRPYRSPPLAPSSEPDERWIGPRIARGMLRKSYYGALVFIPRVDKDERALLPLA
jgi:hypothetical protein